MWISYPTRLALSTLGILGNRMACGLLDPLFDNGSGVRTRKISYAKFERRVSASGVTFLNARTGNENGRSMLLEARPGVAIHIVKVSLFVRVEASS